jgi:ketosteroid isomerase-like protein
LSQLKTQTLQAIRLPAAREVRQHRTLDERILVRFSALAPWLTAALNRLPRHSRLRCALLVRRARLAYAAVNRRDFDLAVALYDPNYEYHLRGEHVAFPDWDLGYVGHDGFRKFWRQALEAFDDIRFDPEEILDLGDRRLITVQISGHGTGSGVAVNQKLFQLFTYRRGLIVRQDDFSDRARALEAAGLSEQDGHADS